MQVTFRKLDRRYEVAVARTRGAPLVPRIAPGFDPDMPHDLAHFLVEQHFEIRLGIFGQLAAGGAGLFAPLPRDRSGRAARTAQRLNAIGRADSRLSERLVDLCVAEWNHRRGLRSSAGLDRSLASTDELDAMVSRLGEVSARWRALHVGGALVFEWPERLRFDPRRSRAGRRVER